MLSPRLKKIAEYAGTGKVVADIGTDHALIPVFLVKNGLFLRAFASDVVEGPLIRAKEFIAKNKLENKIETVLSDGLDNIPETDTVIIAGMGGELIADILRRAKFTDAEFILQPMTAVPYLRKFLYENGFDIADEDIVSEKNRLKFYSIIKAKKVSENVVFDEKDTLISPALARKKTSEKENYIKKLLAQNEEILANLKKAAAPDIEQIIKTNRIINIFGKMI